MNMIESLDELISELDANEPQAFVKIAKRLKIPMSEFEPYTFWKSNGYTRNCIERTSKYELLLLCWNPGDETPIHGHNEQRCWVYQVEGKMTETRYKFNDSNVLEKDYEHQLTPGRLSYMMDDMGYHTLKNEGDTRTMTLHLYISPIDICDSYDAENKTFLSTPLEYHSYKGVLSEACKSV